MLLQSEKEYKAEIIQTPARYETVPMSEYATSTSPTPIFLRSLHFARFVCLLHLSTYKYCNCLHSFSHLDECRKDDCHKASRNSTFGYCRERMHSLVHSLLDANNQADNCGLTGCNNLKLIDPGSNPPLLLCRKRERAPSSPKFPHCLE